MKFIISFAFFSILSIGVYAESGNFGVEVDVTTSGLFPPRLDSVTVATIEEGSSAFKAGIKQGDKVISIADCLIPGCSAFRAKKLMQKDKGEKLKFGVISENGVVSFYELVAD